MVNSGATASFSTGCTSGFAAGWELVERAANLHPGFLQTENSQNRDRSAIAETISEKPCLFFLTHDSLAHPYWAARRNEAGHGAVFSLKRVVVFLEPKIFPCGPLEKLPRPTQVRAPKLILLRPGAKPADLPYAPRAGTRKRH